MAIGQAAATLVVLRDATARTDERAHLETELRLRESQRLALLGSWELDLVTNTLSWSDEIFRIFELDASRFGASYEAFLAQVHPDDRQLVDEAYRRSVEQRTRYELIHRLQLADGRVKHVHERGQTFYDATGRPLRSIGTVQDITSRVLLEERLRLRDEAIAGAASAFVFADLAGRLTSVNESFLRLWGYPGFDEVLGRAATDFWDDPDEAQRVLEALPRTGAEVGELVALRKDGSTFVAQFAASVARRSDGEPIGLTAQFVDVTARVEAERALSQKEEQLRQSQKLEALGRLAGGIAHDFNNMLTVVLTLGRSVADLVKDRPEALELMEDVLSAGEKSVGLTRQLLAFARVGRSSPRELDLGEKVREFSKMMRRIIGEDVKLVIEVAPGAHVARLDPTHLEQVLLNLAANARDAMPHGGSLTVAVDDTRPPASELQEPGALDSPCVHLLVRDTGQGMTDEVRARVFEPFFTTKDPGKGTGLGLATVHGIVRQASGVILVESTRGEGTTFHLFFPRVAAAAVEGSGAERAVPRGAGECLLLVEDEPAVRDVTARLLRDAGYLVVEAKDGAAALEVASGPQRIDLVITDVVMPGMSGPSVVHSLAKAGCRAPVLFISGYAPDEESLEKLGRLLRKPYTRDALLETVRAVLNEQVQRARPAG